MSRMHATMLLMMVIVNVMMMIVMVGAAADRSGSHSDGTVSLVMLL